MSAQNIYKQLIAAGLSHAGACGMLGNMEAESSLKANIAQRGMTKLTDEQYTTKFDVEPESCYRDAVGYGLCQWTYWSRKQGLYNHCKLLGKSVGDEEAQVSYCIQELKTEYSSLFKFLCSTNDLYTATARICKEFERPAINNIDKRHAFAQKWDKQLATEKWVAPDLSILILQAVLVGNGYNTEISGHKDTAFLATLKEFVKDIGG